MTIEEKIRDFIFKSLYFVEGETLDSDASFLEQGIIDSRGAMELVAYVETEFGIKVEMSDVVVDNFDSIQKLACFINRKIDAAEPVSTRPVAANTTTEHSVPEGATPEPS